jgi:hypothetical protein
LTKHCISKEVLINFRLDLIVSVFPGYNSLNLKNNNKRFVISANNLTLPNIFGLKNTINEKYSEYIIIENT